MLHCHLGGGLLSPPPTKGEDTIKTTEQTNKPERQLCATHRDLLSDCGKCLNGKEEKRAEDMFGPFDLS